MRSTTSAATLFSTLALVGSATSVVGGAVVCQHDALGWAASLAAGLGVASRVFVTASPAWGWMRLVPSLGAGLALFGLSYGGWWIAALVFECLTPS